MLHFTWVDVCPPQASPFRNEYHTIACAECKFIYNVEVVEEKEQPRAMGKKEFE